MTKGTSRYVSRLESLGAPRWVGGLCVLILVAVIIGDLVLITAAFLNHADRPHIVTLAVVGAGGMVALLLLARLWKTAVVARGGSESRRE